MSVAFNSRKGLVVVRGEVSGPTGSGLLQLALDTGATSTVINVGMLVAVGYDPALAPERVQVTTGSGVEFAPRVVLEKIIALGLERSDFPVRTGRSAHPALAEKPVFLYSDLLLHNMGAGLADGIVQGIAGSDEFRIAPLWGLGLRLFLLHDGRTRDLAQTILLHDSPSSEAHGAVVNYRRVPATDRRDLLDFLRSL